MNSPVTFTAPVQVVAEANRRDHWTVRHKRVKAQRWAVGCLMRSLGRHEYQLPLRVTFTRIGGRRMDTDNLTGAFKAIRDEVAAQIGHDDGNEQIEWRYMQRGRNRNEAAGVTVMIEHVEQEARTA